MEGEAGETKGQSLESSVGHMGYLDNQKLLKILT